MPEHNGKTDLPLSPKVFHILLALAAEPRNGYQLGLRVDEASEGVIRLSPGTLYENLHRLSEKGMIREVEGMPDQKPDGRGQRFYALTEAGLETLRAEVTRLSADLALARSVPAVRA
jgi:DNA-binding PadR family transcriptional regulator